MESSCVDKDAYTILLAPFQPKTKIELETYINTTAECCLNIKNTGDKLLNVTVTKAPAIERQITLSPTELEIPMKGNGTIIIKWSPKEVGMWRDVIELTDSRRIKFDVIIATTAKNVGKANKARKRFQQSLKSFNSLTTDKSSQQRNTFLKASVTNKPVVTNCNLRMQQNESKYKNNRGKENIFTSKYNESKMYKAEEKDRTEESSYEYYKPDVLSEQHMNVWNDGSVLPQSLSPSKTVQDIRRATYIKETKHHGDILYERNEEISPDTICSKDKSNSEFSILINKFTLTSTEVVSSSPQSVKSESMEFIQNIDKHKTFNISHSQFFETPDAKVDTKSTEIETMHVQQSIGLYNLSPIKSDDCFRVPNMKDLIASSPIVHLQHNNISRDPTERLTYFRMDINSSIKIDDYEYFSFDKIPENIKTAKKAGDMYIEISPPKKHSYSKSPTISRLSYTRSGRVTKDKNLYEGKRKFQLTIPATKRNTRNVPAIRINKLSLSNLSKTKGHIPISKESSFERQSKEEPFLQESFEIDLAPFTTEDPFLKNTLYCDEQWLLQQEFVFTKWLNALLSSPEDLSVDIESAVADIGKIWQSCRTKDAVLAETKETVSARYHTNIRLNILRKAARTMFNRKEVTQILSCATTSIMKGILCIRSDRNLHRDIGLQKLILGLFLNYNPLWLRIGLETIYNECIPLRSNNDIIGLTRFLLTRFFSDPRLIKMPGYHKTDPSKKFVTQLNQFILKKFLFLIYFLDYAKQHKLIGYDPCLFHKRAIYKESREILLSFSREVLSGIGDVTKLLRGYNYILTYRQTFIEEYDYAVVNIRCDLRDGVRLCRAMELITGVRGLTQSCRTPTISRLQRVYNVEVALNALRVAGFVLEGDIDAKSIADGHREKTLSLLWQIIHKYQAPKFNRAACIIQRWWRAQLWYIRVREYVRARKNNAAIIIQRAWKCKKTQSWQIVETCDLEERRIFLYTRTATIYIQRWWREVRGNIKRVHEIKNRHKAVIELQRRWRATLQMRVQRNQYHNLKNAVLTIQKYWRAKQTMKLQRSKYLVHRDAVMRIQLWWRSTKITQDQRDWFLRSRENSRIIQAWWRRHLLAKKERNDFLRTKTAVLIIERWWLSIIDRKIFLLKRTYSILIQRKWREYHIRKRQAACLKIQAWWRTVMCLRKYKLQKSCCVKLQRWWRAVRLAKHEHAKFLELRNAALIIQKNWRAKTTRKCYLKQRTAISLICSWYRRTKAQKIIRQRYLYLKGATIRIQNWWRNIILARAIRTRYLQLRKNALFLQTHWRRHILARTDRQRYLLQKNACIIVQSWWRMIRTYNKYKRLKIYVIGMQRKWRAIKITRVIRKKYLLTCKAALVIQSYYRMKSAMRRYQTIKYAALIIQSYWRAYVAGKRERLYYLSLRQAAISVQRHYRRKKANITCEELLQQEDITSILTKIKNECGDATQMNPDITNRLALPNSKYWQNMINVLRNCNSVGVLLTCLSSLDTITKLSPSVCITLCELNLVDEIYKTIAQSNRSLPWMKVCVQACSILITLTTYSYTRKYTLKKEYALPLVKLLSSTLKEKQVFLHCATLIWSISQDEDYLKFMVMCPQISWLLKNIQQKILKDDTKLEKLKDIDKLFPSCEPHRSNMQQPRLFTDMSFAILAIVKKICT